MPNPFLPSPEKDPAPGRKARKRAPVSHHNTLYDTTPDSRLWRHVLIRAAIDAAFGSVGQRLEVIAWLNSADFDTVCHYAAARCETIAQQLFDILAAPKIVAGILAEELRVAVLLKDGDDMPNALQREHRKNPENR